MARPSMRLRVAIGLTGVILAVTGGTAKAAKAADNPAPLAQRLARLPFRIAWECYVDGNWEIFVANAGRLAGGKSHPHAQGQRALSASLAGRAEDLFHGR